jgi:hypothetical protein
MFNLKLNHMKATLHLIFIFFFIILSNPVNAREKEKKLETVEFKVSGVCDMCEQRVEHAALIKGVRYAQWNKEKQLLKVIYKTKHTVEEAIHEAVAKAGHDTEKVKAPRESYKKLPACCAYRDGVEIH